MRRNKMGQEIERKVMRIATGEEQEDIKPKIMP
jgi:hypothetical protein